MIPLHELRAALRLGAERDDELASLLANVTALLEAETLRPWAYRQDHVEVVSFRPPLTPESNRMLWLALRPVLSVTSVETADDRGGPWTALDVTDWAVEPDAGLYRVGAQWEGSVRVVYSGGYRADAVAPAERVPDNVKHAMILQIRFDLARHSDERLAVKTLALAAGSSTSYEPQGLHPAFARCCELYRAVLVS